jgi:hypothetical protein
MESTIAPYYFKNNEVEDLYKNHYKPTGLSWSEVVEKYGSPSLKRYFHTTQRGRKEDYNEAD